jgi:hypothetical protein
MSNVYNVKNIVAETSKVFYTTLINVDLVGL